MTREEKFNLLNELLEYEEKNDIGLLTRAERREFQQWISEALEQEPKKGHWIDERNDYGEIIHWHCSNCYDDSGYTTTCKWDYCPNCGADMREPKRGHWIPTYGNVKCSVCGSVKDSREVGKATHYCDFCGAKMESEGKWLI